MSTANPPKYVRKVLVALQSRGHMAYLVGGCVRDILLEQTPQDWDICTSALPGQVMDIFPGSRPTGLKHGTVTVTLDERSTEVTTFRAEGAYADHRRPDNVSFVGDLTTDLSRRDFTMNAMALSLDGLLIDPFGGAEDIRRRCVRCVGTPALRFEEDALRMFRALRFAARLDFEIDPATLAAMEAKASLARALAAERVRDETEKILLTKKPETVYTLISLGLLDAFLRRRPENAERFSRLALLPRKALERWCGLCRLLTEGGAISSAESFLGALRLDSRTIRCSHGCAQLLASRPPETWLEWKRMLKLFGVDTVSCAALCMDALSGGQYSKELKSVLKSGECFSLRHLAVGGDELVELGLKGRELGEMLNFLLDYVIEHPENNRRELLLGLARGTEE